MTLLRYHGFDNWQNFMLDEENERDNILFGFELEAVQDNDFNGEILSPEEMAESLKMNLETCLYMKETGRLATVLRLFPIQ